MTRREAIEKIISADYIYQKEAIVNQIFDFFEKQSNRFTGLTQVMFIDPYYTIKNQDENNPIGFLIDLLDSNGIDYTEWENGESREIRIENTENVLDVLKEHFNIAGNPEGAEYFIFWEDFE